MLPGLQFTDFHKFLVSVGGLSLASGIALPLVLLRSQKALLVPERDILLLAPSAAKAVRSQQDQLAWLIRHWPMVSLVLVILGVSLVVKGAIMWKRRQDRLNERDDAEIDRLKAEREKFHQETLALARQHQESPSQADVSLEEKAAESAGEENFEDLSSVRTAANDGGPASPSNSSVPEQRADEGTSSKKHLDALTLQVEAEELVLRNIRSFYRGHLDIVRDVRINGVRADALVVSQSSNMPNLILDIRIVLVHPNWLYYFRRRLQESIRWISQVKGEAVAELHADVKPVVLFVFNQNPSEATVLSVRRLISRLLDDYLAARSRSLHGLIFLTTVADLRKTDTLAADLIAQGGLAMDTLSPRSDRSEPIGG
ncbi:hypothetical protein [Micromonospora maris]|uniref:hypothetical protein n=1 Tax=Micromonospora maris TaxID=1003110 RepID=UPI0011D24397|nr:hypothetical protein [Micromonospora maris]